MDGACSASTSCIPVFHALTVVCNIELRNRWCHIFPLKPFILCHRPTCLPGFPRTYEIQYHFVLHEFLYHSCRKQYDDYRNILKQHTLHFTISLFYTVETLYNTVNFCWNTHKRHSIARPKGRGMGCLLWVQRATYCVDLSKLSSIKYLL